MPERVRVAEIMNRKVITIGSRDTVQDAAKLMKKYDIEGLIVVDNEKVKGVITNVDIIDKVVAKNKDLKIPVKGVMTKRLVVGGPSENLVTISKRMRDKDVSRIPIVDKDKNIIGIVTRKDLSRIYPSLMEILYERLEVPETKYPAKEVLEGGTCEECGNFANKLSEVNGKWICEDCLAER